MFILSQFTYNAFRFVELNLHKLVLSNEKQVECDKKLVSENNVKKKISKKGFRLGRQIG